MLESARPAVAVQILSVIPGLRSLEIHGKSNIDGIIKLLDCNLSEGAVLVPRLTSLQFPHMGSLTQELVVKLSMMIASRAQNVEVDGLQELTLRAAYSATKIDLTILQSQCEEQDVELTVGGQFSR